MPIDFRCQCGRTLRVPDNAVGKQARCPSCGDTLTVPESSTPEPSLGESSVGQGVSPSERNPFANPLPPSGGPADSDSINPYASPSEPNVDPTAIPSTTTQSTEICNQVVDIGTIFEYSMQLWKDNLGLLVGTTAVMMAINMGFGFISNLLQDVFAQVGDQNASIAATVIVGLLSNLVQIFLTIGQTQICLNLARGQFAEFSQLFRGGPRLLPVLGVSLCLGVLALLGIALCMIPGTVLYFIGVPIPIPGILLLGFALFIIPLVIFSLMWWPCYYLVVDAQTGVFESFRIARLVSANNKGTIFLAWLLSIAIILCGMLACCIGIVFAAPLTTVLFVTCYLMMSGQLFRDNIHPHYG